MTVGKPNAGFVGNQDDNRESRKAREYRFPLPAFLASCLPASFLGTVLVSYRISLGVRPPQVPLPIATASVSPHHKSASQV